MRKNVKDFMVHLHHCFSVGYYNTAALKFVACTKDGRTCSEAVLACSLLQFSSSISCVMTVRELLSGKHSTRIYYMTLHSWFQNKIYAVLNFIVSRHCKGRVTNSPGEER